MSGAPNLAGLSREQKLALLARLAREKSAPPPAPLSFAQQRLWFLDRLDPGSHVHTIFRALRLAGRLDRRALARALVAIENRHAALRTVFRAPAGDGEPRQHVRPPAARGGALWPAAVDLAALAAEPRAELVATLAARAAKLPFDLERGPLARAVLLVAGRDEHALLLALHHVVADGWSLGLLYSELAALYARFAAGEEAAGALPELGFDYPAFARWQREELDLEPQLDFWRRALAGAPGVLELPADRRRPAIESFRGEIRGFRLPAELRRRLEAVGRARGATLFMTLLAGFAAFLHRLTGRDDLLLGTPIANRHRAELEPLIGSFANTLVLRAELGREGAGAEPSFETLLARLRRHALDAYQHQDLPFERLVEELAPERDLSRNPLFQVMFALLHSAGGGGLELSGVEVETLPVERGLSKVDLTLEIYPAGDGLGGYFEYAADLFDGATIERWIGHLETLLEGVAADPATPLGELPLLTAGERQQLLAEWGVGPAAASEARTLVELFAERVRATPEATALVAPAAHGGAAIELDYARLAALAARVTRRLEALGVGPETRVALLLERSPQAIAAMLGVLGAGAAYVPLDPSYPPRRLAFMLDDSGARALITQASLRERLGAADGEPEGAAGDVPTLLADGWLDEALDDAEPGPTPGRAAIEPEHAAYVIYTSGSTGRPKGVVVPHRAAAHHAAAIGRRYALGADDRVLQFASLAFDISVEEIFPTLAAGAALVLRPEELSLAVADFFRFAQRQRLSVVNVPTPYWHEWISELAEGRLELPAALRLVVVGTEQALPRQLAGWLATRPPARWINAYGPSEATVTATAYEPPRGLDPGAVERVPIGRPMPGARARVLDRRGRALPLGVPGQLHLAGEGLARGYLGRPALTAERFAPDPFSTRPGERLYATGDLARWLPGGEIEFLGRVDRQVKIRGFRIETGEIEAALAEHARVAEAVVEAIGDGDGDRSLVAWVALGAAAAPETEGRALEPALRRHLERRLPAYMLPARFVFLAELPLTASGKIDRRALPRPEAGRPELPGDAGSAFEPPRGAAEELVAELWAEVLGLPRVGREESFFALGGHSLLATRILARLRRATGVELPLRALFERPTVAALARALAGAGGEDQEPVTARGDRTPPLSFGQERLWFLDQLEPGSAAYNMPALLEIEGALEPRRLARALDRIVERHEVLRTVFPADAGRPRAEVLARRRQALPAIDLSGLGGAVAVETLRLARAESRRAFDLAAGPPLRTLLLRLGERSHRLLFTFHHIVSDGWSTDLFLDELSALVAGEALPPLPVQYGDFAAWQRERLDGEAIERELGWWRERLDGAPATLELPADRPRPRLPSHRGGRAALAVAAPLAERLIALGRARGATPFMTFLAAFAVLVHRHTGQREAVVGTPVAGRARPELEPLIGFFVNTLALRLETAPESGPAPGFGALIESVRAATLDAHAHQDLPFERLVDELAPERRLAHHPIFQALFVLHPAAAGAPAPRGLALRLPSLDNRTARFDLTLSLVELDGAEGSRYGGFLEYAEDLFDAPTAERLARRLERLLAAAAEEPATPVDRLPLLSAAEREQLVHGSNDTARSFAESRAVHRLFAARAAEHPERVALRFEGESWSYARLARRAAALARRLAGLGARPDALVAVALERSPELVATLLAVLETGAAYLPLDPEYPAERLATMLADSRAAVLVADAESTALFAPDAAPARLLIGDEPETAGGTPATLGEGAVPAERAAYAIYTSGSTGTPKGVVNAHGALLNRLLWMQSYAPIGDGDAVLQKTPTSFDVSVWELFWPLIAGARMVLARPGGHRDPAYLARLIEAERVTTLHFVPSMLHAFLGSLPGDLPAAARGAPLRIFSSGEALPRELAERVFARLGAAVELHNLYGPTEAAIDVTYHACRAGEAGPVPIGRPVANTRVYVVDRRGELQPPGVPGELMIGGVQLARGYHRRPALTAERFVPDPFSGALGARLYRSGDLVRARGDGEIVFLGRLDHQVKLRGLRVELGEIEAALEAHAAVRECAVVVREDVPGDQRLVAYLVPAEAARDDEALAETLRAALRRRLPEHMVPGAFVALAAMPLTPSGKLDRRALPAPAAGRAAERALEPPRTPVEEELLAIWRAVLGRDEIGVFDHFFDLGGHSLLATQVVARVRDALAVELPVRALFEQPTIAGLAERITDEGIAEADDELLSRMLAELANETE